jgi:hypothetical protein
MKKATLRKMVSKRGWYGFDLDGTLARYDHYVGPLHIGDPIPATIAILQQKLAEGYECRIMTARAHEPVNPQMIGAIQAWCRKNIGVELPITNQKDFQMIALYDDRCIQLEPNTGRIIGRDYTTDQE